MAWSLVGKQAPLEPRVPAAKAPASSTGRRMELRQCPQPVQPQPAEPPAPPVARARVDEVMIGTPLLFERLTRSATLCVRCR